MGTGQKGARKPSLRKSSSRDGETSPAHNVVQRQLDAFADQLTVDEALTAVSAIILFLLKLKDCYVFFQLLCTLKPLVRWNLVNANTVRAKSLLNTNHF